MRYTGLIKRFIPFAITFAAGLFIASFFVAISWPALSIREGRRFNRFQEMQQLRRENEEIREKYRLLRIENDELRRTAPDLEEAFPMAPPVDFEAHHPPPPPPKRPKNPRFE